MPDRFVDFYLFLSERSYFVGILHGHGHGHGMEAASTALRCDGGTDFSFFLQVSLLDRYS